MYTTSEEEYLKYEKGESFIVCEYDAFSRNKYLLEIPRKNLRYYDFGTYEVINSENIVIYKRIK